MMKKHATRKIQPAPRNGAATAGGNTHQYHYEASFGEAVTTWPEERQARQWLADRLGEDPGQERYLIRLVRMGGNGIETIWSGPEYDAGVSEGLEDVLAWCRCCEDGALCPACAAEEMARDLAADDPMQGHGLN